MTEFHISVYFFHLVELTKHCKHSKGISACVLNTLYCQVNDTCFTYCNYVLCFLYAQPTYLTFHLRQHFFPIHECPYESITHVSEFVPALNQSILLW